GLAHLWQHDVVAAAERRARDRLVDRLPVRGDIHPSGIRLYGKEAHARRLPQATRPRRATSA
ncbi:MAG: hypothetical protein ACK559_16200, partial [bacterium]